MSRINPSQSLDFQGTVGASGNPKIYLDGGPTYDTLLLETNLANDEFTFVVEVNGDRRVELTGVQMQDRAAYDGQVNTSGYFLFSFADVLAKTLQGEALSGLVTKPGDRVMVSLEIESSVTPGSPAAVLYTETSPSRPEEFRLYCLPEAVPITKTGKNTFDGFREGMVPAGRAGSISMRRFFAYGAVTHLSLKLDRRYIFGEQELPKAANDALLKRLGKTVPTSSTCYVYDPIARGNVIADMQDTYNREAFRAFFTTSSSSDVEALTEYVERVVDAPQAA